MVSGRRSMRKTARKGGLTIARKSHTRKSYYRRDGTFVSAAKVSAAKYRIADMGRRGKTSRGAKSPGAVYGKEQPWITQSGKLGGPGYLSKSTAERHRLLDRCVREYGYRSCLGSVIVLMRSRAIMDRHATKLNSDKDYMVAKHGSGRGR